jgi:hypothetical protein
MSRNSNDDDEDSEDDHQISPQAPPYPSHSLQLTEGSDDDEDGPLVPPAHVDGRSTEATIGDPRP